MARPKTPNADKFVRKSVSIRAKDWEQIEQLAKSLDVSTSHIIRRALSQFLADLKTPTT